MEENKSKIIYLPPFLTPLFDKITEEYKAKNKTAKAHPWQVVEMLMREHEEKK